MKIVNFSNVTQEKIQNILRKYEFIITRQDDYHLEFQNDKVFIEIFTSSRRHDGNGFIVKDKSSEVYYSMFNIAQQVLGDKWNIYNQFMTEDDVKMMYKLDNSEEGGFYALFSVLENYCDDIINGNFEIMHGENSEIIYSRHRFR
jgi:hypothetical protein